MDPTLGEKEEGKSRLEEMKCVAELSFSYRYTICLRYYTSIFLGAVAIVCVFGFLFLVPFVLDPAISTLMHQFVEEPVHCKVRTNHQPPDQTIRPEQPSYHFCQDDDARTAVRKEQLQLGQL